MEIPYRGDIPWLVERTILFTRAGSRAYGLDVATSDEDFKGVAVPPREYTNGFLHRFEQVVSKEPDLTIFDVRKFFALATECNPNILEVLYTDPIVVTWAGKMLLDARDLFLSKKAKHTFSGYAVAQLRRIQGHHRWLKNPPVAPPTRAELGLPEHREIAAEQIDAAMAAVQKKLGEWHIDWLHDVDPPTRIAVQDRMARLLAEIGIAKDEEWQAAARTIGLEENFIHLLDRERQYRARQTEWEHYRTWQRERNPKRAELEAKVGFDSKHGMHLVRLLKMAKEILTTGEVIVKRPDREELLAIRNGAWTYEQLVEWAEKADEALNDLYAKSALPHAPPREKLDALCVEIVSRMNERAANA